MKYTWQGEHLCHNNVINPRLYKEAFDLILSHSSQEMILERSLFLFLLLVSFYDSEAGLIFHQQPELYKIPKVRQIISKYAWYDYIKKFEVLDFINLNSFRNTDWME